MGDQGATGGAGEIQKVARSTEGSHQMYIRQEVSSGFANNSEADNFSCDISSDDEAPRPAWNKPRGHMTAYACFVQTFREEQKKKHPDENILFEEFSKKCAERWITMNEKEKHRFQEMAEKDKNRYEFELEMQSYVPPMDAKVPNVPKRPLSAFFWFTNDERSKVTANTMGEIARELATRWAAADPETQSKYEQLAEEDKQRYDRELTAYKKQQQQALSQHGQGLAELQIADYNDDE